MTFGRCVQAFGLLTLLIAQGCCSAPGGDPAGPAAVAELPGTICGDVSGLSFYFTGDEFLHRALKLPRYDRLAVPGGAACLAGHFLAFREEEGLMEQLRFLVRVHGLQRVVLIAHQDCAFYTERLHVSPLQLETQQREDIRAAALRVRSLAGGLQVEAFMARTRADDTVQFESLRL